MSDEDQIVRIVDAGDVTEMLEAAFKEEQIYPNDVTIDGRAISGPGQTLVHGVALGTFDSIEDSPIDWSTVKFNFEINAGTTSNNVVLGELEVVIENTREAVKY